MLYATAMTDSELEEMSIEDRNRAIDAWWAEVEDDIKKINYAETKRLYEELGLI